VAQGKEGRRSSAADRKFLVNSVLISIVAPTILLALGRGGASKVTYTGPKGNPGGERRFPSSCNTDGVVTYATKLFIYLFLKILNIFSGPWEPFRGRRRWTNAPLDHY
jgi:hypothetical protein